MNLLLKSSNLISEQTISFPEYLAKQDLSSTRMCVCLIAFVQMNFFYGGLDTYIQSASYLPAGAEGFLEKNFLKRMYFKNCIFLVQLDWFGVLVYSVQNSCLIAVCLCSLHGSCWKQPLRSRSSNLLSLAGCHPPAQTAQGLLQPDPECPEGWGIHLFQCLTTLWAIKLVLTSKLSLPSCLKLFLLVHHYLPM